MTKPILYGVLFLILLVPACKKSTPDIPLVVAGSPYEQFDNPVIYVQNPNFPEVDTSVENYLMGKSMAYFGDPDIADVYIYFPDTFINEMQVHPGDVGRMILGCEFRDSLFNKRWALCEFNLKTKEFRELTNCTYSGSRLFSVNANGNIVYIENDNELWVWSELSGTKKHIATQANMFCIAWKKDGSQFALKYANPMAQIRTIAFYNKNFQLDSTRISNPRPIFEWPLDRYLLCQGLLYDDLQLDTPTYAVGAYAVESGCMTRKGELLYFGTANGKTYLASYNFGTKIYTQILENRYLASQFGHPRFSAQDSTVYLGGAVLQRLNGPGVKIIPRIYKMGMNASNPTLIKEFR